jgi:hypothetical protein
MASAGGVPVRPNHGRVDRDRPLAVGIGVAVSLQRRQDRRPGAIG